MTVALTDVITTVSHPRTRRLLDNALTAVRAREEEDRRHREARQVLLDAAFRSITDKCKKLLPVELLEYVRSGEPLGGWDPPAPEGARFWLRLELPGLEAPLMGRFERSAKFESELGWTFVDYVIPGLATRSRHGREYPEFSLAENYRTSCGSDPEYALTNLVALVAEYRERQSYCAVRDAHIEARQS